MASVIFFNNLSLEDLSSSDMSTSFERNKLQERENYKIDIYESKAECDKEHLSNINHRNIMKIIHFSGNSPMIFSIRN